jgi:hypothetical protein
MFSLYKVIFPEIIKVSVKFSLHKSEDKFVHVHSMKIYGTVEAYIHSFVTSTLDDDEWSTTLPGCFYYRERTPTTR